MKPRLFNTLRWKLETGLGVCLHLVRCVYTGNYEKCLCVCLHSVDSEDGAVVCEPGCLVLDSDFLLSGELEFGDSEIMGLDRESGQ